MKSCLTNNYFKTIAICFVTLFFLLSISCGVYAGLITTDAQDDIVSHELVFTGEAGFDLSIGLGELANYIISAFLGLLAIIFIILIIIGGYGWMMAGGDEGKVTAAKERIRQAIIGLIITVSAYAITYFVFNALPWGG
ncbi:hypothetical protein KAJ89_05940 [Candidatus Parcubacteria bacterium]|nr:hypothetical protein [Candidatus Parcubacteria bacterium]